MLAIPLGSPLLTPRRLARGTPAEATGPTATRAGTLRATALLGLLAGASALALWSLGAAMSPSALRDLALASGVLAFAAGAGLALRPRWSPGVAPLMALCCGLFAGGLALAAERRFPGMAVQAVAITFAVLAVLVGGYRSGLIRVGARLRAAAMSALAAVALVYLGAFVLGVFGLRIPFIGSGWGALLWSAFVAVTAALNFLVDVALIDGIDRRRWPRHMQWYVAAATVVTSIWLYVTVLRLLQRAQSLR